MSFDKLRGKLEAAHEDVAKTAIPPQLLALLMDVVISLLGGCLQQRSSKDVAKQMKENPVLSRLAIRRALRKQNVIPTDEMVETVLKAGDGASASDLDSVKELDFVM